MTDEAPYRLHGLKLSYFTGKLEAYLRAKGVPFEFVEMDSADFRACARATGIAQMPQLEGPDGCWLTDTTAIIARFEATGPGPAFMPADPAASFLCLFLEDAFDEWLWRPALYYRWAFAEDARLMGGQIARTMLRDLPGPLWLRALVIRRRQQRVYLREDGVTRATAPVIEGLYGQVLALLEPIFAARPFLCGARPCIADFGLFGSMFRHFASDPTPAAIMRETAPNVLAWTARLWALTPEQAAAAPPLETVPADLDPLLRLAAEDHLTELAVNAEAVAAGRPRVAFDHRGVRWRLSPSPYRARCLADLRTAFAALSPTERSAVAARLGPTARVLAGTSTAAPQAPAAGAGVRDRRWA
jgi:glutathione S-transferase